MLAPALITGDPLKLDLGCGGNRPNVEQYGSGWIGIDIDETVGADHVLDLRHTPWPIAPDSVEAIYTAHFLEHLSGPERLPFMDECFRVLKAGAKMTVIVPYWSSMRSIQDPFHAWPPIAESSFLYFNRKWRDDNKLSHYPIRCDFDFSYGYVLNPNASAGRNDEYNLFGCANYINFIMDLVVTLTRRE